MTDQNTDLPPISALDKAAKASGWHDWKQRETIGISSTTRDAIIAFARYIAAHEPPPVDPVRVAEERLVTAILTRYHSARFDHIASPQHILSDASVRAALDAVIRLAKAGL